MSGPTPASTPTPTPDVSPTTIPGDLPQLDEANARYTRGADGLIHVRLYLAPVGVPARQGWLLRDPAPVSRCRLRSEPARPLSADSVVL